MLTTVLTALSNAATPWVNPTIDYHALAPEMVLAAGLCVVLLADLFLDTFTYSAHTTASDALFMGLPMVTMMGESFASRVAGRLSKLSKIPKELPVNITAYIRAADSYLNKINRTNISNKSK